MGQLANSSCDRFQELRRFPLPRLRLEVGREREQLRFAPRPTDEGDADGEAVERGRWEGDGGAAGDGGEGGAAAGRGFARVGVGDAGDAAGEHDEGVELLLV